MKPLILAAALLLTACGGKPKEDVDDFGAAQAARQAISADRACESVGFEDLASCGDAENKDAALRRRAMIALSMTSTYTRLCSEVIGRDRCDDMLVMAYLSASKK